MQVSIIIATYNPDRDKLFDTLYSLINQQGVETEIIVCDDCSKNEAIEWCEEFFAGAGFDKYSIVRHKENVGTCKNIYDGVIAAKGEYVKLISPGDFLIGTDSLKEWYEYAVDTKSKVTFAPIVNYCFDGEDKKICSIKKQPINDEIYLTEGRIYDQKINYCYLSDTPVGAAYLTERNLLGKYLKRIVGKLKYAEDMIYRLVVLDDEPIRMFSRECVAYECNTGISTSTNDKWVKILDDELNELYNIAAEKKDSDSFVASLTKSRKYKGIKQKLYKIFGVKKYLYWIIKLKMRRCMTSGTKEMLEIQKAE